MTDETDLPGLSRVFLAAVRRGDDAAGARRRLADADEAALAALETDAATAFWLNVYNAAVQFDLERDPSLYDRKRRFFGAARHEVAGTSLSLDDVEHGILRSSKWKYGLGYLPRPFPSDFERRHRLPEVDPRIHFALNCGAESCPAIAAYTAGALDDKLDASTRSFLEQSCTYDAATDVLRVSRLFFYYRGDFGGRSGIYAFLERYGVVEDGARPSVRYEPYDWTRHTGKYREPTA
ncbi:MAG: DUF547 domain-containing protein [Halobacteriaceae archaeon]